MKLSGTEIRSQGFPLKMRGYSKLDVDAFLQQVGDAVDGLIRKNEEQADQIAELVSRIKEVEEREALLESSLQAINELRGEMRARTDSLLQAAQSEAKGRIRQAEEEATRIREKAEWNVRRLKEEVESLENLRQRALMDFVAFLRSQHQLLKSEADRLGVELSPVPEGEEGKVVSINKKAEGEEK